MISCQAHLIAKCHLQLTFVRHDQLWNFYLPSRLSGMPTNSDHLSNSQANWFWPVDMLGRSCWVLQDWKWFPVWLFVYSQPTSTFLSTSKVGRVSVAPNKDWQLLSNWKDWRFGTTSERTDRLKTSFQDCSNGNGQAKQWWILFGLGQNWSAPIQHRWDWW